MLGFRLLVTVVVVESLITMFIDPEPLQGLPFFVPVMLTSSSAVPGAVKLTLTGLTPVEPTMLARLVDDGLTDQLYPLALQPPVPVAE